MDKGRHDARFIAHLVTAKCADSIPLYRLEKEYQRIVIPVARSTMTDLFHRAAEQLFPLYDRLLKLVAASDVVVRRAIDLHEGEKIDEEALKALIRDAVTLDLSSARREP